MVTDIVVQVFAVGIEYVNGYERFTALLRSTPPNVPVNEL
jgi:hypothetical protein